MHNIVGSPFIATTVILMTCYESSTELLSISYGKLRKCSPKIATESSPVAERSRGFFHLKQIVLDLVGRLKDIVRIRLLRFSHVTGGLLRRGVLEGLTGDHFLSVDVDDGHFTDA